jgi:D-beta-D-heptose 7-phosphate kinase/D-beta-D-heptose 1-phosphate adenosyltransferase
MANRLELSAEVKSRLVDAIRVFPNYRVFVLGDVILDVFIWGEVHRISPEAPVPVVEVSGETRVLGGAANVVNNVAALGGKTLVAGLIGNDGPGRDVVGILRRMAASTEGLIVEQDRPTSVKTRIIASNQQVVRYDRERRAPLSTESRRQVLSYVRANLDRIDGLIISDYSKGVVTEELMDDIRDLVRDSGVPVVVDPKVYNPEMYRRVTMITPNNLEASRISGVEIRDEATLLAAGARLLERLDCRMVLITRGSEGMSLFQRDEPPVHIPTVARRVFDVTGAGDTVIAAMTLGMAAGLSPVESALLANIAAGIVVGEVGTASASAQRLLGAIEDSCSP